MYAENPGTPAGIALGERLFFDTALSTNGVVSCATCHRPERAFTDGEVVSDRGVSGRALGRNTPTLVAVAWSTSFFADGGSKNLESQALGPLTSVDEMGNVDLTAMMAYVEAQSTYVTAFSEAFGEAPTIGYVLRAVAQYERALRPETTRYDEARCDAAAWTEREQRGQAIFDEKCASCHAAPMFMDDEFHNNGLDAVPADDDEGLGRARVTFEAADRAAFKTPTLRSLVDTAPYMHDGRFADLGAVIEHYSSGIVDSVSLDRRLPVGGFGFDASDKAALLAFLHTL